MNLLHRNFTSLQSSLDTAQQVSGYKVHNHLTDNQNLLREVNQLRSEVKGLSLENQRLAANIEFMNARRQEQINAFNAQFISVEEAPVVDNRQQEQHRAQAQSPSAGHGHVTFPSLGAMPAGTPITDSSPKRRVTQSILRKATNVPSNSALIGSYSQPALPPMDMSSNSVASGGNKSTAKSTKSRPMKSIEQLLGTRLDHFDLPAPSASIASNSAASSKPLTADEKVAKIIELNFEEIKTGSRK